MCPQQEMSQSQWVVQFCNLDKEKKKYHNQNIVYRMHKNISQQLEKKYIGKLAVYLPNGEEVS